MNLLLVVTTDGRRDLIGPTIESIYEHVTGWDAGLIWDDSGDDDYRQWLWDRYADRFLILPAGEQRIGYTLARQRLWSTITSLRSYSHIANWEDDFVLSADVNLCDLATILDTNPHLAQMALLRADYYPREMQRSQAGRILGWPASSFRNCGTGHPGQRWMEHKNYFTCNPHVHHRSLCDVGWPDGDKTEGAIGDLLRRQGRKFGHWGWRDDPRILHHIGAYRMGRDY